MLDTINKLIEFLPVDGWELDSSGFLRRCGDCPLVVGAKMIDPDWGLDNDEYGAAAERLGLSEDDGQAVACAADDDVYEEVAIAIRQKLLAKAGLTETNI